MRPEGVECQILVFLTDSGGFEVVPFRTETLSDTAEIIQEEVVIFIRTIWRGARLGEGCGFEGGDEPAGDCSLWAIVLLFS